MIANYLRIENFLPKPYKEEVVYIKFGKIHYRIQSDQIAYLYKKEGIFFLVDKLKLKLPLSIITLHEFPLKLSQRLFFCISDTVVVNRENVHVAEGLDENVAIAWNSSYRDKFKIPKEREKKLRSWLLNK